MNKQFIFIVAIISVLSVSSHVARAQSIDTIRVCTYNVQRGSIPLTARTHLIKRVLNEIGADIIIIQGLKDYSEYKLFQDSVALVLDRPLADKVDYFEPSAHESYSSISWDTTLFYYSSASFFGDLALAAISYRLHFITTQGPDSIDIISGHWQGGDTETDRQSRRASSESLHSHLTTPTSFHALNSKALFGGTLNAYSSTEPGYQSLTATGDEVLSDPAEKPGVWHNNVDYADIQTSFTRSGLTDRFDQVLISPDVADSYVPNSYTVFGNDGEHFFEPINIAPNLVVSAETAEALANASDHLPVYIDLLLETTTLDVEPRHVIENLDLTLDAVSPESTKQQFATSVSVDR